MNKSYVLAATLGVCMPLAGVFLGLQVSTLLGNIFAHPLLLVSIISGEPIGALPGFWWAIAIILSVLEWILVVYLVQKAMR